MKKAEASENPVEPVHGEELPSYFEEPEPEPRWKRALASRTFRISVILAVLAGILVSFGPALYREIKARRALAIFAGAEEAIQRGDAMEAQEKIKVAFSLAPGDPRVIRILTRYKAVTGEQKAFETLIGWLENGSATPKECLALAGIAIKKQDASAARKALDSLPANLPPDLDLERILAHSNLLANEGRFAEAAQKLREANLPADQMRRIQLVLGTLLLTTSPETEEEGRNILRDLGKSDTAEGLAALRQLASHHLSTKPGGVWDEGNRLLGHPQHTFADVLLCNQIEIAQSGADRERVLGDLISSSRKLDIKDRVVLAQWLLAMQAPSRVEGIFSREDLASSEPAFLSVADALAAQGRWEDIRTLLNFPQRPQLDEALRQLFLSKVARQLGEEEAGDVHWQAVFRELTFSPIQTIRQVVAYALSIGRKDSARRALELLVDRKEAQPGDFTALIQIIPPTASAEETLAVLSKFQAAYPKIPEVQSDSAYLSLLTGRDLDASYATAKELAALHPDYLSYLSVLALAELRRGRPADADRLYEGRQIDWSNACTHFKVVRIAVLEANGRPAEAETLRATLDPAQLRPEEQELVKKTGR